MKFLCDQMLGTLAKWLRICGFDTFYASAKIKDEDLIDIAKKEKRSLITRDKQLIGIGRKENLKIIEIDSTDLDEQLKRVLSNISIDKKNILSRCTICNSILNEIRKEDIGNKIPKRVFEKNEKFWLCTECNKIYWMGSHYDKIVEKIKIIKKNHKI
ncbi:MAG: Mut7-C RNAse domain-containing protein [Thermoplasmatales archaeon]|nr:MAG: Mut7-C RNAse domain-containing protein [Thermoplasmatales archaeon]